MSATLNVFACLVHEAPECVGDLVDNLRFLDPDSRILFYDGSAGRSLIKTGTMLSGESVIVHPEPSEMTWGKLHGFALDCMRYALESLEFEALTIVVSASPLRSQSTGRAPDRGEGHRAHSRRCAPQYGNRQISRHLEASGEGDEA